jgi:hypothetical protein
MSLVDGLSARAVERLRAIFSEVVNKCRQNNAGDYVSFVNECIDVANIKSCLDSLHESIADFAGIRANLILARQHMMDDPNYYAELENLASSEGQHDDYIAALEFVASLEEGSEIKEISYADFYKLPHVNLEIDECDITLSMLRAYEATEIGLRNHLADLFDPTKNTSLKDNLYNRVPPRYPMYPTDVNEINKWRIEFLTTENQKPKTDENQPKEQLRWADLSEDEDVKVAIDVLSNVHANTRDEVRQNCIYYPVGLANDLPFMFIIMNKWCQRHGYTFEESPTVTMRNNGFKYPGAYNGNTRTAQFERLNILEKQNLADVHNLFSYLALRPDSELKKAHKSTSATYALYLIFKKLKMTEENRRHIQVSLKHGDAGENLLHRKFYSLFSTGSEAADLMWRAFHIMFNVTIDKAPKATLEVFLKAFSETCFTSTEGMLVNSYRSVVRYTTTEVDSAKKGKRGKEKKSVRQVGKDVPAVTLAKAPLKDKELTEIQPLINDFNNFAKVVNAIDRSINSTNIFQKSIIVEEVTKLAYHKVGTLRKHIKRRKGAIREQIVSEKKEVNQTTWLAAQSKVLQSDADIDIQSLGLSWDLNKLKTSISPLVLGVSDSNA